jgi:hypothetical protein
MEGFEGWQKRNDQYLAKALSWLRLRLARFANQRHVSSPETADGGTESELNRAGFETLTELAAELIVLEETVPPPALVMLSRRFGLSRFEQEVLLLSVAMELDTRVAAYCAQAQDHPERTYPTFALALTVFDNPAWEVLSPERALRHWRLIEINQPGAQPLTTSALRADERIVNYIKGLNYLDDRLAPLLFPLNAVELPTELPPSQRKAVDAIVRQLKEAGSRMPVIELLGSDEQSKHAIAARAAAELGLQVLRLPAPLMPTQAAELETLARLIEREIALWPFAVYLEASDYDASATGDGGAHSIDRLLQRTNGIFFLDPKGIRYPLQRLGRTTFTIEIARPTPAEQRIAWTEVIGSAAGETPNRLAGQFDLNLSTIHSIAHTNVNGSANNSQALERHLWDACLASTRPRLDALAQRIDPKATWEDIVLPESELSLLRQIAGQVGYRHKVYEEWGFAEKRTRGLSINALFTGESGTGKTMAAEVIANELRLNLYRIDLSAVVSKYIGETEKNLRRLFDAAEDGGAILFFDEADALFGKRSEVKDSHDRYANIEINYLLQRIEAYRGLAILATNMKSSLDQAFMRRIRFIVEFRPHGQAERKAIWGKIFPWQSQTIGLDFEHLASLNLNGGSINNVAINAAFLAARAGTPVTMALVLLAAREEFLKLKRPFDSDDFNWPETKVATV